MEKKAHTDTNARLLVDDTFYAQNACMRLIWHTYESDDFSPNSVSGYQSLRGALETPPDNKCCEDMQAYCVWGFSFILV